MSSQKDTTSCRISATNGLDDRVALRDNKAMTDGLADQRRSHLFVLIVSVGVWGAFFVFNTAIWIFERGLPPDLPLRASVSVVSAALTYVAGLRCLAVFEQKKRYRWVHALAYATMLVLAHSGIAGGLYKLFPPYEWMLQTSWLLLSLQALLYNTPIVTTAFFALFAVHFGQESAARERQALRSDLSARRAQLETLRYQLNPHFLFNTLNTISNIVMDGQANEAEKAILRLSKFLRRSIDADPVTLIPLADELENVEDYLSIERIRFEDRLTVEWDASSEAKDWPVPPFLLQPAIENVVKHAVAKVIRPVTVKISTKIEDLYLQVEVCDDGPGAPDQLSSEGGVGLRATRERLKLIYGADVTLNAGNNPGGGFIVSFRLPLERSQDDASTSHR